MAKESNFKNMFLCLLAICFGGSAIMGGTYVLTKDTIDAAQVEKVNTAIAQVIPAFDNQPSQQVKTFTVEGKTMKMYPGTQAGTPVGCAVEATTSKGFGGNITVMIGFLPDGTIYKSALISHSETPGLGEKLDPRKSPFTLQFEGKNPSAFRLLVKKDGGDVDAITAATISSRAFCDVTQSAYNAYMEAQQKGGLYE